MRERKDWIVVTNKFTYIFLLIAVFSIVTIVFGSVLYFMLESISLSDYGMTVFLSLAAMLFGFYFFIKFNTYSALMNPNHPKSKGEKKGNM